MSCLSRYIHVVYAYYILCKFIIRKRKVKQFHTTINQLSPQTIHDKWNTIQIDTTLKILVWLDTGTKCGEIKPRLDYWIYMYCFFIYALLFVSRYRSRSNKTKYRESRHSTHTDIDKNNYVSKQCISVMV